MSTPSISFWRQDVNWYVQQQSWTQSFYQADQNWTQELSGSGSLGAATALPTNRSASLASHVPPDASGAPSKTLLNLLA